MDNFDFEKDFLDSQSLAREFALLDIKNAQGNDPYMIWRSEVNLALAEEGINISWQDDVDGYAIIQPLFMDKFIKDYEKVPQVHLVDLFDPEDGTPATPKAVAAYLKAVLYDKRFRLWQYDEEE